MTKLIIQHLWSDFKKQLARDSCDIGIVLYCYHFCVYLWILVFHGGFRSLLAFRG